LGFWPSSKLSADGGLVHKKVLVTHLGKMMLEELQRRNYSDGTIRRYLHMVEDFACHFDKSPEKEMRNPRRVGG